MRRQGTLASDRAGVGPEPRRTRPGGFARGAPRRFQTRAESVRRRRGRDPLLALESRIREVREWPFDTPSLARFALYVTLGVGSWLGAAGVERLLDLVLA